MPSPSSIKRLNKTDVPSFPLQVSDQPLYTQPNRTSASLHLLFSFEDWVWDHRFRWPLDASAANYFPTLKSQLSHIQIPAVALVADWTAGGGCYLALWASVSSPHSHRRRSWRGSLTKPTAGSLEMKGSAETGTQSEVSHQRDIKVSQEEIVTPVLAAVVRRVRQRTHQLGPESKPRSQVHKAGTCPPHSLYMSRIVAVFSHDLMAPCTLKAFTTRLSGTAGG